MEGGKSENNWKTCVFKVTGSFSRLHLKTLFGFLKFLYKVTVFTVNYSFHNSALTTFYSKNITVYISLAHSILGMALNAFLKWLTFKWLTNLCCQKKPQVMEDIHMWRPFWDYNITISRASSQKGVSTYVRNRRYLVSEHKIVGRMSCQKGVMLMLLYTEIVWQIHLGLRTLIMHICQNK
jgi:hypothetical protein